MVAEAIANIITKNLRFQRNRLRSKNCILLHLGMEKFAETQIHGYMKSNHRNIADYSQYEIFTLICQAQQGNEQAMEEVLGVLSVIGFQLATMRTNKFSNPLDAYQAALGGVWDAVRSFDWKQGVGIGKWCQLHVQRALKTAQESEFTVFSDQDKDRLRMVWRAMEKLGEGATPRDVLRDIQAHADQPGRWDLKGVEELMQLAGANNVIRLDARVNEEGSALLENLIGMDPESLTEHQQWERDLLLADQVLSRLEQLGIKADDLLQDGILEELVSHANAKTLDGYLKSSPKLPLTPEQARRVALEIQGTDFSLWN